MTFDVKSARSAGYSDDEIADHLGQQSNFDVPAARKSGYGTNEIIDHLSGSDTPAAQRDLVEGVKPSTAGAGRGITRPAMGLGDARPSATPAPTATAPAKGRSGSVLENVILDDPQLDPDLNRQAMLQSRSPNSVMFTAGRGKQEADQAIEQAKRPPVQEMREAKPVQPRSIARAVGDTAIGLTQGALGMAKGVADNINAGDNPVSDFYEGAIKAGDRLKSDDLRDQQVKRDAQIYQAGKNGGEIGEARASFNTLFSQPGAGMDVVARGAGSMIPTVGLGLAGAGTKLMGATNALSNAGDAASQTADALRQLPPSAWQKNEDYRAMVNEGASHDEAVSKLAPWLALPAQIAGGATGFITGSTGLEKVLAGKAVGNSIAQRAGRAGVEMLGEQAETLAPQMVGNTAVGELDGTTGITKGLGRAAVETAAGALPGSSLAAKSVATPDAQPSAEQIARQKGFLAREQRIQILTEAGDTATADLLQKKHDRLTAIEEVDGELQRMPSTPEFANNYRDLRGTGMKPAEAAARSAVTTTFQGAAVAAGIPDAAMATALEKANGMPLDEVPAFLQKFTAALEKRGLAQPGAVNLGEQLEMARDDAIEAAMGAVYQQGDIRNDMNDVLAMEGQGAPEAVDLQPNQPLAAESLAPVATESVATDQAKSEWQQFTPETGTLNIPRAEMPQVKNQHRGAMVNFLNARGVDHEIVDVDPASLKPTQAEFSPEKVAAAQGSGGNRAILISSDDHIIDGHHQALAKLEDGEPVKAIRLGATAADLIPLVNEFPSSTQAPAASKPAPKPFAELPDLAPEQQQQLDSDLADANEREYQQSIKESIQVRLGLIKPTESDQKKTPFKTFLRQYGIAPVHTSDIAGKNRFKANNVLPATFRAGGLDLDSLVERAIERGFMTEADRGDQGKLISMIQSEIAGDFQVSTEFADDDAAEQTERMQRMEIEGQADKLGLPYSTDTSTDQLASMVNRVQRRMEKEVDASYNGRGSLKSERVLANAREVAARIERKRAQYRRDLAQFEQATIAEQDAVLEILTDDDGYPVIVRGADISALEQWLEENQQWDNGYETDSRANQDSGQTGAPVAGISQEGAGNGAQAGPQEQRSGNGASDQSQEGSAGSSEGLTAPTRADVLAQQERTGNAQALDDRAQIDAEASRQTLTRQNAPEQRRDTSIDMFGEEKAVLESAKRETDAAAKNEAAKDPNQGSMFDEPAETEAQATGDFGPILTQFRHDAQGAIKALTELQDGEAVAALQHPEVGDIDLVWGKAGTKESNGSGLAKLVKWHPEVVANLQGVISSLKVVERTENRIQLESETHKAAVRLEWNGTAKKWLLTAFEKKVVGSGTRTDTTANGVEGDTARLKSDAASVAQPAAPVKPAAKAPSPEELRAQADLMAALADLGDIFGKNTRMNMMPEQEAKILPVMVKLFDAAFRIGYIKFKDAAKFTLDKIRAALGSDVADDITLEHLQGAYISMSSGKTGVDGIRAVSNIESKSEVEAHTAQTENERTGESNAPSTDSRVERDRQGAATEPTMGDAVSPEPGGTDQAAADAGGRSNRGPGRGQLDGIGLSSGGTAAAGNGSDQRVPGGIAESELASVTTGDQFSERGASIGISGIPPEPIPAKSVAKAAQSFDDALTKSRAQKAAANVKPITGDLQNIRDTLPQLLPNQQEDVHLAEQRFAKSDGYGMLFTNGTGTGKTFSGLGIIKRHELQGKTNTLILAPDTKIASDWIKSGKLLGLNITELADTKDAGKGIVITTYANFGANDTTATRQWDLVVADEAHTLMQDKDGTPTSYLHNLRAITYHPNGAGIRHTMLNRDKLDKAKALGDEIESLERMVAADSTTDAQRNTWESKSEALQKELADLRKALFESQKAMTAEVAARQGATRPRLVALSATPFAYEKTIDWGNGYLFDYNEGRGDESKEFRGYNAGTNREQYFMQHFGYSMQVGKLTGPDARVDSGLMQRQWNGNLKKTGALSGRMLDVVPDYDRRFVTVDSAIGNRIDEALEWLTEQRRAAKKDDDGFAVLSDAINAQFKYQAKRYLLEAIKADAVIPIVKAHMALGRKVVVFHDYKKGGGFNPFAITPGGAVANAGAAQAIKASNFNEALAAFNAKFGDLVSSNLGTMDSPIEIFSRELPQTLLVNGDEKEKNVLKRYELFQDDASGPLVMLVQSAKNKGWSGHDTTGKHQRVLINLGQPTAPTTAIQQEGRIYRTGQASDAIMRYLNTGTNWERWTFASTIAGRASTAENLGMGEMARALKDSFIQSFEESDTYAPGHEGEGKGGKERDKAANDAVTEYDRAKSMYFATQKKNSQTKAQEGVDYFATPEPVGLKMVQWLDARPGENLLEPSAGHGAIARWLPSIPQSAEDKKNARQALRTVVEPSMALRSRLALAMDPNEDRIIAGTFEDLDVTNKYDGIVMNPPFGTAGRTAVDHIAKAATHLRDGGRIVALLPMGAATAKFDKWFYESTSKPVKPLLVHPTLGAIYRGDTITFDAWGAKQDMVVYAIDSPNGGADYARPKGSNMSGAINLVAAKSVKATGPRTEEIKPSEGLHLVANIQLPQVTFERAGTAVATRIVVIEKGMPTGMTQHRDLSGITNIKELFNRLENMDLPARAKPAPVEVAEPAKPAKAEKPSRAPKPAAAPAAAVGDQISMGGKQYPVEVYTTNAGKELRGVWVGSKAEALKYGPSTFEKRGKGFFVRERDFPKAGAGDDFDAPMLSRKADPASEQNALNALSKNDELFSLPKSTKDTVEGIAADTDAGITVKEVKYPGLTRNYVLTMPDGSKARMMVRAVNPYGPQPYGMLETDEGMEVITERPGENAESVPQETEDVYIDVSLLKEGGYGSKIYNIAATYAHNTGRILIGDPNGLSDVAMRRRTEHMLSSALKFGTTRHLAPHPRQVMGARDIGVPPMFWTYGDDVGNINSLIQTSLKSLDYAGGNPFTFDPETGTFRDSEGAAIDDDAISLASDIGQKYEGNAGSATLKRGAVLQSLVRQESAEGRAGRQGVGILARLVDVGRQYDAPTKGIFYSRGGVSSGLSSQQAQAHVDALTKTWANAPKIVVVKSTTDLPIEAPTDARGLYFRKTVYVVADNNANAREVAETLSHEAIAHHGLREMLGRDDWLRLMGNIQLALASGNKPLNAIRAEVRKAYVDENGVYNLNKNQESDEITARAVESAIDPETGEFRPGFGFMKSVYAKLAQFLRDIGINVKFTNLELQGLLVSSLEGLQAGSLTNGVGVSGAPVYSRSPRTSQEAADQADFDGNIETFARGRSPQANLFQPTGWSMPDPTRTDRIIYELQDGRVDLKRAQAAIEQTGQQIIEKWDARLAETLYPGRVAYRSKAFLDTEVKPLLEAMARQNLGMNELADYLHARGAEERNKQIAKVNPAMPDGGAGTNTKGDLMTNQAARDYLANIRPARLQVLDAMAKRVDTITGGTRALLVTEGLEKQSTIDAWEGAYKNYVPMFRDEAEAGAPHPQGSGFSVRGSASKRATGSTKEVTNILAHVLMQREAAITRAEKNRVGLALYGQAMSHPNPEFWTTIKPSMKPAQIAAELMAMGVDPMTAQIGMEGVPTIRTVDPTTGNVVDRPNPMYKSLPGAIPLRVNGEDRVLMINVTGERGARMAASLKNMDGLTELDIAGSIVGKSTRWLASVNTQYNPAFGLTNLTRDVLGGVIHLGNTELRGKALKVLLKTPVAIVGIARELASGGQSGKWQTLFRQFQADGGQTGFKENFRDPNERAKAIESELKGLGRASWNPTRAAHAMLSLLDGFNTTLENAVRLSAYSEALDKGISRANAARLGRELTVDFNRKGRMGAEMGPLYAFFNASVQGANRSIQAIKGPTGSKIIAGGLGLGVAQALMLMMAGYDEDEIPEFVKTRALIIPLPGKEKSYITIPYPLGLHVIPNTGRVLTELALNGGKDIGKRTGEAIGEIAGAFNPLGGGNIFTADGALKTVAPTVIDPLIEMGFNKNFAGSSIQREGYGGERDNRPGVARTKESTMKTTTGQVYMEISKAINTMTGGTDYEKGAASPTPEMIRYMAQTVGGGVLRELEKSINASTAASRGEPVKPSAIPVVGRFYGEVDNNQVQTSRYFKTGDKLAKMDSSLQAMVKAGDGAAVQAFVEKNPDVVLVKLHRKVGTSIAQLNKLAVQTVGNPEASAQIDQARVGLMSALNQAAENAGKATRKATLADMIKSKIKAPAEAEN